MKQVQNVILVIFSIYIVHLYLMELSVTAPSDKANAILSGSIYNDVSCST